MCLGVTVVLSTLGTAPAAMLAVEAERDGGTGISDAATLAAETPTSSTIPTTGTPEPADLAATEAQDIESTRDRDGNHVPIAEPERSMVEELRRIEARQAALIKMLRSMLEP
jgi:hypothetical protein